MAKIIKETYENYPAMKFVGKCYQNEGNPNFSSKWIEAFQNRFFEPLDKLSPVGGVDNGYIGLMKWDISNPSGYEYWIGVFTSLEENTPTGYQSIIVPASRSYTCFLQGTDDKNLYDLEGACFKNMQENKLSYSLDEKKQAYCYERNNCPRFTEPNENKEVIMDFVIYIK